MGISTPSENHKQRKKLQLIKSAFFEKWISIFRTQNSTFFA